MPIGHAASDVEISHRWVEFDSLGKVSEGTIVLFLVIVDESAITIRPRGAGIAANNLRARCDSALSRKIPPMPAIQLGIRQRRCAAAHNYHQDHHALDHVSLRTMRHRW